MFGAPPIVPEVGRGSMVAPDRLSIVDLTPSTHMLAGGAHIWLDRQEQIPVQAEEVRSCLAKFPKILGPGLYFFLCDASPACDVRSNVADHPMAERVRVILGVKQWDDLPALKHEPRSLQHRC